MFRKGAQNQSVIFCEVSWDSAYRILSENNAFRYNTKERWLLRESSIGGLLTLTYFSKEDNACNHERIGFFQGKWVSISDNRKEALEFVEKVEASFGDSLPDDSSQLLYQFLNENGFKLENQICPKINQKSNHKWYIKISQYMDDEENSSNLTAK